MKIKMKDKHLSRINEVVGHIETKEDWLDYAIETYGIHNLLDEGCIVYSTCSQEISTPYLYIKGTGIIILGVEINSIYY